MKIETVQDFWACCREIRERNTHVLARFEAMQKLVAGIADKMGMPVDKGIAETVVMLNLLGFKTRMSCEGHLEWGRAAPWVAFDEEAPAHLKEAADRAGRKLAQAQSNGNDLSKEEEIHLYQELHEAERVLKKHQVGPAIHLLELLTIFYTDRRVPFDQQLYVFVSTSGICSMLFSHGAEVQDVLDLPEREERLHRYQEEMSAFTTFLKARYFALAEYEVVPAKRTINETNSRREGAA